MSDITSKFFIIIIIIIIIIIVNFLLEELATETQILDILNMSDINSNFFTIATFLILHKL